MKMNKQSDRARAQVVEKPPFFMKPTDHREVIHVNFFAASVRGPPPPRFSVLGLQLVFCRAHCW